MYFQQLIAKSKLAKGGRNCQNANRLMVLSSRFTYIDGLNVGEVTGNASTSSFGNHKFSVYFKLIKILESKNSLSKVILYA